jgi:hypothetical protein
MFGPVEKIENFTVEFDEKKILRLIGYKKRRTEIKEPVKSLITEEKKKLDYLLHPAFIYTTIQSDQILAEKAREMNLWPSKRFSPGYAKWDIKEQRFIFRILSAADIVVRLTESCMMVPRKSISFRINFYKEQKLSTRRRSPKAS